MAATTAFMATSLAQAEHRARTEVIGVGISPRGIDRSPVCRSTAIERFLLWAVTCVALGFGGSNDGHSQTLLERCQEPAQRAEASLPLPYRPTSSQELIYLRVA